MKQISKTKTKIIDANVKQRLLEISYEIPDLCINPIGLFNKSEYQVITSKIQKELKKDEPSSKKLEKLFESILTNPNVISAMPRVRELTSEAIIILNNNSTMEQKDKNLNIDINASNAKNVIFGNNNTINDNQLLPNNNSSNSKNYLLGVLSSLTANSISLLNKLWIWLTTLL